MNQEYIQTIYENEEDRQTARTLSILIWVTWGAYLVVFISGLYWGDRDLLLTTLISSIFLVTPFWLLKRGYLLSSGYVFMLMVLGMVTVAATLGQGIHDVAIMTYPGIIISASLALDRVGFKIYVVLTLASMGWLVFGEASGLFVSEAFEMPSGIDYLIIATLLLIVAMAVDLLTTNMRKNLELARREIAQRQQADEALQESEKRFRTLIENAPIAITLGRDGKLMYANPVYAHMHGFSNADEVIGHPTLERVAPQSRNESLEHSHQLAQGLPVEIQYELIGLRLDGTEFPMLAAVTQVNLEDGLANVGFFQDITERKQAEEDLRRIKDQYENIVNTIPVMLYKYVLHPDGSSNFLYVSPKMCREILELDSEVVLADMNLFWNMVHSKDLSRLHQEDVMANQTGKIFYSEVRITTPSSRIKWVALNSKPNPAKPGEPAIWSGFLQDITARKQAEESLRASEERLRIVSLATQDAIYDWDIRAAKVYRNESYQALFSPNEPVGTDPDGWENQIHPDDRARVLEVFEKAFLEKQQSTSDEYRFRRHDGTYAFVQDRGYIIYDAEGRAVRMIGAITDFTERKRAEDDLFQQKNMLDTIIESTSASIFVKDTDGKYIVMNEAGARMLGYSVTDVIGHTDLELLPVETASEFRKMDEDAMASGQICEQEEIVNINGKRKVFLAHKTPWRDNSGKIIGIIGVSNDITERKQAEELLLYKGTHDALTGIYNRAFFEVELARFEHSREFPTSMIIADVDKLKFTNDTLGHTAGDGLIRNVANVLRSVFRESDVLARIGGDEFAVLLPSTDSASAEQMLIRVQERLAKHNAQYSDLPPVQLSLGTATAEKNNLTEAFIIADRRMYANKAAQKAQANDSPAS